MKSAQSARSKSGSKTSKSFATPFEALETRRMMDATPLYWVCGTGGNDVITVSQRPSPGSVGIAMGTTRSLKVNVGAAGNSIFSSDQFTITINGLAYTATIPAGTRIHID